jgi:hypothetical protein
MYKNRINIYFVAFLVSVTVHLRYMTLHIGYTMEALFRVAKGRSSAACR